MGDGISFQSLGVDEGFDALLDEERAECLLLRPLGLMLAGMTISEVASGDLPNFFADERALLL